jgi:hypothetical protein
MDKSTSAGGPRPAGSAFGIKERQSATDHQSVALISPEKQN